MSIWLSSRINRQKINDMLDIEISDKVWHKITASAILVFWLMMIFLFFWLFTQHVDFLIGLVFVGCIGTLCYHWWKAIHKWVKRKL